MLLYPGYHFLTETGNRARKVSGTQGSATSKTFKLFAYTVYKSPFARRTPYTFTDNPIIQIAAKYSNKNSHYYGLSLLWTLSHGLEIVRLERVVLSFKDLEAGRSRLMWTLFTPPLEKLVLKIIQCNVIIIIIIITIIIVIVVVYDGGTYWGP